MLGRVKLRKFHVEDEILRDVAREMGKENSFDKPDKAIVKYLMEQTGDGYVDFVAVGNNGADYSSHQSSKYLGSVANGVIRNSNLNVIFVA